MKFDWHFAWQIMPQLLKGAWITLSVTILSFGVALIGGAVLLAILLLAPTWVSEPLRRCVDVVRSTPLLVQIFFLFYMLPEWGVRLGPYETGIFALGLHYSCYLSDAYRAALFSVTRSQWSAGSALGLTGWQTLRYVVFPQMGPIFVPIAGSLLVYMFKDTPILAAITVREMMQVASQIGADNFRYMEPLTLVGGLFLAMSLLVSRCMRLIERRTTFWR
ncbi:ectoine/hydroxyectoine ABC transporter permease subunit EhuD [Burkholderia sp. SG-MS1]|uniref:ectoine/hydroxyectoine ABC transporter permease subunit EhuD n=1 Tax=Paraburkholderia sp. SG-MS1 TaxID=2023741 RepID=UPI0014454743|nr:ectoine/hydroxyectoine ABC transporter permease subunit EhuD [Paraburkholderia sp. SG-MS1]NKJ45615.1 ectoine/hydroxyectoine ABC transporter permease subunit EhuD [Paraburkholderia sp. SG-MS1]